MNGMCYWKFDAVFSLVMTNLVVVSRSVSLAACGRNGVELFVAHRRRLTEQSSIFDCVVVVDLMLPPRPLWVTFYDVRFIVAITSRRGSKKQHQAIKDIVDLIHICAGIVLLKHNYSDTNLTLITASGTSWHFSNFCRRKFRSGLCSRSRVEGVEQKGSKTFWNRHFFLFLTSHENGKFAFLQTHKPIGICVH